VIKDELRATAAELDSKRRTDPTGAGDEVTFDADAFIVDEDATSW